jgi:hypothetical protein
VQWAATYLPLQISRLQEGVIHPDKDVSHAAGVHGLHDEKTVNGLRKIA